MMIDIGTPSIHSPKPRTISMNSVDLLRKRPCQRFDLLERGHGRRRDCTCSTSILALRRERARTKLEESLVRLNGEASGERTLIPHLSTQGTLTARNTVMKINPKIPPNLQKSGAGR